VDTLYLIAAVRPRFTVCGAQPKYFSSRARRLLLGILNIIKVESREQFMHDCCELLKSNEVILIYPAMGRVFDGLGEFKTWAAEVAIVSQARVIPLYLYGTTKGQHSFKWLMVGEPIQLNTDPEVLTQDFYQAIMDLKANLMACQEESLGIQ
jgi:1-acyl-sn-glycerol-3-phosphate acyltransferase